MKTKSVVDVLEGAHKLALVTWNHSGAGCDPGHCCLAECIVVAAGQPQFTWGNPQGVAHEAALLLSELIHGTEEADDEEEWMEGWYPPDISLVWRWNDDAGTKLQDVSDLLLDAIAIAKEEERA